DIPVDGTISFGSGHYRIHSLTDITAALYVGGGTFSIAADSTIDSYLGLAEAGTLTGEGTITINGTFNWSGGGMSGTGTTVVGASGILNVDSRNNGNNPTLDGRTLDLKGSGEWFGDHYWFFDSGATFTIESTASFDIRDLFAPGTKGSGGTWNVAGTLTTAALGFTDFASIDF